MNSDRANDLSLKYLRCSLLCFKDVGVRKIEFFFCKTQILISPQYAWVLRKLGTRVINTLKEIKINR